jgi:hypothetical protein
MNNEIQKFLSTFGEELRSKVKRLDDIIGRDHWLSVGNYKESLVRNFLRSTLPKRYEISTGFILSKNYENQLIKSKQIDILIWDSTDYSAIFRDGEFVIIPPEACRVVIEVKGNLRSSDIEKTIDSFDQLNFFLGVQYNQGYKIARFLFAFDISEEISFPDGILKKIAKTYMNSKKITIKDRSEFILHYSDKDKFTFDGIYILGKGFITTNIRSSKTNEMKIIMQSFETENKDDIYSLFETEIQSNLGKYSAGKTGFWYEDQPGLLALKSSLVYKPTQPKSIMIVPPVPIDNLYSDIDSSIVFEDSFNH